MENTTILVLGRTGDGKSSFLNAYLQKNEFEISTKSESSSFITSSASNIVDNIERIGIDTQGLEDTKTIEATHIQQMIQFLLDWDKGVNVVAIVINGQYDILSSGTKNLIKLSHQIFNHPDFFNHVCLIFTKWYREVMTEEDKASVTNEYQSTILKVIRECPGCEKSNPKIPFFFVNSKKWKEDSDTQGQLEAFHYFAMSRNKLFIKQVNEGNIFNESDIKRNYSLIEAIDNHDINRIKLLIEYANINKTSLKINETDENGNNPLLKAIKNNKTETVKVLLGYANKNNIILEINEKNNDGYFPLFGTIDNNNIELFELLIEYAKDNKIKLIIKEKDIAKLISNKLEYIYLKNISEMNTEFLKLIEKYKNENIIEIIFNGENSEFAKMLNKISENAKKDMIYDIKNRYYDSLNYNDINGLKLAINDANNNNIILNVSESMDSGDYPFLQAIGNNNIEMVMLLIDYANKNKITLDINKKNKYGLYPLIRATTKNNTEMVKLLIDYANKNNIILDINKTNRHKDYPLLCAIDNDNIEIIKLLIDYADNKEIILNVNKKNSDGYCPVLCAIDNDNIEIIKLLIDYANKKNIILNINEINYNESYPLLDTIDNYDIEIVKLLMDYANKNNILLIN